MKPPALKPGDTIGVMAPSSIVEKDDIRKSAALLEKKGYKVFIHPQTWEQHHQSAGTVLQKALAFQGLWQRQDIKVIWTAGGGNRGLQLLEAVNFEALKKNPKALVGFSDVTALLNAVYAHTGTTTFHGPVFKNLHRCNELGWALKMLSGETCEMPLKEIKILKEGRAEGPLIGGNLSIFQYLPRTLPGDFWKDSILFLEDCGDEISRIDRMLFHLKRLGVFQQIKGLMAGDFTDLSDTGRPFGFTLEDLLQEYLDDLNIPVILNVPFGHGKRNHTLPLGQRINLNTKNKTVKFPPAVTQN